MKHLPAPKEIKDLFGDLLGKDVEFSAAPPLAPGPATPATVAVYVDDALEISALIACDLPLSCYAGAALGLVPPGAASDAVNDGRLTETLSENLYEVLNVAASLFNAPGATHLRLYEVYPAGGHLDVNIQARTLTLGQREDARLEIAGYGSGQISIVLV
ncbi:hypothetical protein ACLM5J_01650 [Nocardioides sp. Bht2]|uniref:hypothetical protein n=1 Tax=Nocardioides sp. Bht2 TaxID=3392297 RepID=UPI0039B5929C